MFSRPAAFSLRRQVSGQSRRQFAVSAAESASVWDSMFMKSTMSRVPLTESYCEIDASVQTAALAPNTQVTTLSNGLRVATQDSSSFLSSIGIYCDVGSRYENHHATGLTNFLERMALKSTHNRSEFRLVREMSKLGVNLTVGSSREHMVYSADTMRENVDKVVGTFADLIQNHAFKPDEIEAQKAIYRHEMQERAKQTDLVMMEAVHEAGYCTNTVGKSLFANEHSLSNWDSEHVRAWQQMHFTPKRMVVSAVGVNHGEFVKMIEQSFTSLPKDQEVSYPKATYTGGEVRMHNRDTDGLTHVAVGFEGASWHSKDLVAMCVLQLMMGGGGSFSAGGPGKGMYSRLYQNVLNHAWVEQAVSFNAIYKDTALFGFYAMSRPEDAKGLVELLAHEAKNMASNSVQAVELQRAKNQLKGVLYMNLESRPLQMEDMGRNLITYGKLKKPSEVAAEIDAVTGADLQRVAAAMLKTTPTLAAYGDLSYLPRYEQVCKLFK